jgi:hypothetical protein
VSCIVNIAKMFHDEVREKKRTASGVHHRTGKRGYVGKLYFTSDLLKGKEKRAYKGTGRVKRSNMYDTIIPLEEFEQLDEDKQRQHLQNYKIKHTGEAIMRAWNINSYKYYKIIDKLGIKKEERQSNKNKNSSKPKPTQLSLIKDKLEDKQEPVIEIIERKERENGMTLSLNGDYSANELVRKLEKFGIILSDEPMDFKVEIRIAELK